MHRLQSDRRVTNQAYSLVSAIDADESWGLAVRFKQFLTITDTTGQIADDSLNGNRPLAVRVHGGGAKWHAFIHYHHIAVRLVDRSILSRCQIRELLCRCLVLVEDVISAHFGASRTIAATATFTRTTAFTQTSSSPTHNVV